MMESKTNTAKLVKLSGQMSKAKKSLHPRHLRAPPNMAGSKDIDDNAANIAAKWLKKTSTVPSPPPKIWSTSIENFIIKPHCLLEMQTKRKPVPSINHTYSTVTVKKQCPADNRQTVAVLRPAPPDVPLQPLNAANYAGPRFDEKGRLIPHSLLGNFEEFKKMALEKNEFEHLFVEKNKVKRKKPDSSDKKESSSLRTWKRRIVEWHNNENHLSYAVKRPVEDLLMNTADLYPYTLQDRLHVHTMMDADRAGHGMVREASRFWKQQERIGSELRSLHVTLKKSGKSDVDVIEYKGVPKCVEEEKGLQSGVIRRHYPAYLTSCVEEQKEKVKDIIHILDPYHPLLKELQVTGTSMTNSVDLTGVSIALQEKLVLAEKYQMTRCIPRVITTSPHIKQIQSDIPTINGPAVLIGGKVYSWEGSAHDKEGTTAGIASVLFDGIVGERIPSYLEVHNVGSTAIHYNWSKVKRKRLKELPQRYPHKFYFLTEGGVVAPGDILRLPIVFRSNIGGIFLETWKLLTSPVLCCGADILINFKSVISTPVMQEKDFEFFETDSLHSDAVNAAKEAVEFILQGIHTPTPPVSPIIDSPSQEDKFKEHFPKFIYHATKAKEMTELYQTIVSSLPENLQLQEQCTIKSVKKSLGYLLESDLVSPEDEEHYIDHLWHRYNCLTEFNDLCSSLLITWPTPVCSDTFENYKICYIILLTTLDQFTDMATMTARKLELPLKEEKEEQNMIPAKTDVPKKSMTQKKKKETEVSKPKSPIQMKATKVQAISCRRNKYGTSPTPGQQREVVTEKSLESFFPISMIKTPQDNLKQYRERLHLMVYDLLGKAVTMMTSLMKSNNFDDLPASPSLLD